MLCIFGEGFAQPIVEQTQVPAAHTTEALLPQSSPYNSSLYTFQEVPNRIQGVLIDLS